jgi:putative oxidoreductase
MSLSTGIERTRNLGLHASASRASRSLAWIAPTIARLTLGVAFLQSGWGKLHDLEKVARFFAELHIPAPAFTARLVSITELVGGSFLLLGLLTRVAALPLVVTMLVAIATAKRDELSGWTDLFGLLEWTYAVLLGWLAISGAGPISVDAFFAKRLNRRRRAEGPRATTDLVDVRP